MQVETMLVTHPSVDAVRVVRRSTTGGDEPTTAYVVPRGPFNEAALRTHLREHLTGEHVPDTFVAVPTIPFNADSVCDLPALSGIPGVDDTLAAAVERSARTRVATLRVVAVPDAVGPSTPPLSHGAFAVTEARPRTDDSEGAAPATGAKPSIADGGDLDLSAKPLLPTQAQEQACESDDSDAIIVHRAYGSAIHASCRELAEAAEHLHVDLQNRGCAPGMPVALLSADNWAFLQALWACVLGGLVPVPIAPAPTYRDANAGHIDG